MSILLPQLSPEEIAKAIGQYLGWLIVIAQGVRAYLKKKSVATDTGDALHKAADDTAEALAREDALSSIQSRRIQFLEAELKRAEDHNAELVDDVKRLEENANELGHLALRIVSIEATLREIEGERHKANPVRRR